MIHYYELDLKFINVDHNSDNLTSIRAVFDVKIREKTGIQLRIGLSGPQLYTFATTSIVKKFHNFYLSSFALVDYIA